MAAAVSGEFLRGVGPQQKAPGPGQRTGDCPTRGGGDGTVILRIDFDFMGSTEWHTCDGTPSSALAVADEVGNRQGRDVERDQAEGPTGWESEFDNER